VSFQGPQDTWGFAVSFGGFLAVAYQLRVEPRRARRSAAIEGYRSSQELRQQLRDQLPDPESREEVLKFAEAMEEEVRSSRPHSDGRKALIAYLNYWETMAAGSLRNVYDVGVLLALSGERLQELRSDYGSYIDAVAENRPRSYEQLKFLIDRVLGRRWPRATRTWLALTGQLPGLNSHR
jgi:hypothetical protein